MNKVSMVTGNMGKWKIASNVFSNYNVELEHVKMNTPEIQSHDLEEVSKYSAEYARDLLGKAVIKSDVGYYIEDLGDFPGPFLRYANDMLTSEDILKMMKNKSNRKILLKECLTFAAPNMETKQFINMEEATIAMQAEGSGTTFDRIVVFAGEDHPKALNTNDENFKHFEKSIKVYDQMAKYIEEV